MCSYGFRLRIHMHIISESFHGTGLLKMLKSKDCSMFENSSVSNSAYYFVNVHLSIFFYSPITAC